MKCFVVLSSHSIEHTVVDTITSFPVWYHNGFIDRKKKKEKKRYFLYSRFDSGRRGKQNLFGLTELKCGEIREHRDFDRSCQNSARDNKTSPNQRRFPVNWNSRVLRVGRLQVLLNWKSCRIFLSVYRHSITIRLNSSSDALRKRIHRPHKN